MLKIKLTRVGKKHQPSFRIVVVEARSKRDGKYLEALGFYNPLTNPAKIKLNQKAFQEWIAKGAQPTERVQKLYKKLYGKTN